MKRVPTKIVKFTTGALVFALLILAFWLMAAIIATVLNADFHDRSPQSITLRAEKDADKSGVNVKLVVHRLLVEENAVEVSLVVQANYEKLPKSVKDENPCLTLLYQDGMDSNSASNKFDIACKKIQVPGVADDRISAETPLFKLTAWPSVDAYPFDDWEFFPVVELLGHAYVTPPAIYSAVRMIPGKELTVFGNSYNWRIHLERPFAEKALVLTVGGAFLLLSLLIAWRLFSVDPALSGVQELLTLAGFVVAIAGLRDLLGVSRVAGVSIWEVVVIGFPMTALCLGMAYSTLVRMRKTNTKNPTTPGSREAPRDPGSSR